MALAQGTHILQQVSSLAQAKGFEAAIRTVVPKAPFTTLCFRVPWNSPDWEAIHAYGKTFANSIGLKYAPRTMAGRYTPTAVLNAGPSYVWSGVDMGGNPQGPYRLPLPCNPDGSPNAGFENAFVAMMKVQDKYADEVNHGLAYGRLWAEVDFGQQPGDVGTQPGCTMTNMVNAHVRLYDLARAALPGKIIEFPLSGHGPATQYINAVTDRAVLAKDKLVIFQMNGWQDLGVMWVPTTGGGIIQPPPDWCKKAVGRAFQAFDTKPDHNWTMMYDRVEEARDAYKGTEVLLPTYAECYLSTSLTSIGAQHIAEVKAFDKPVVEPPPPPDCEEEIAALEAELASKNAEIINLNTQLDLAYSDLSIATQKLSDIRSILG